MLFHQKKVDVDNAVIKQVMEIKSLGLVIDQHLFWKSNINFVSKSLLELLPKIGRASCRERV